MLVQKRQVPCRMAQPGPQYTAGGTVSPQASDEDYQVLVKTSQAVLTPPDILTNYNLEPGNLIAI